MITIPSPIAPRIHEMSKRLAEGFNPDKIILFGSHARGDSRPDSDVDLLVVMEVNGPRRQLGADMTMAVSDMGIPNDILIVTPDEVERDQHQLGTIIRPALREGVILHDRAA